MNEVSEESKKFGKKVFLALLGFFVLFAGVDTFFVYKALSTNTGVVAEHPYERGLHYNDILAEAKKRAKENAGSHGQ